MPIKTSLTRARRRPTHKREPISNPMDRTRRRAEPRPADEDASSLFAVSVLYEPQEPEMSIPDLFTTRPPIRDTLTTTTSTAQDATVAECLPFLAAEVRSAAAPNQHGVPRLDRQRHIKFLRKNLGTLPGRYVAFDASRPWILYWCLNGLSLLGDDVSRYRADLIATVRSMQNSTGGFGGGGGHHSHLACTYAIVLALSIVGGEEAYEVIDRRALWKWLCSLKQPGGGFQMSVGGEVDIRGAYCAAVLVTLLNLPLDLPPGSPAWATEKKPNLFTGLADYIRQCQNFEGGISAQPGGEAHGAYAFCALGCLSILDAPHRTFSRYLDVPLLISWLSSRQHAPEGGFSGRTNKLVDGCYSHWVGCCWPLIEAAIAGPSSLMFDVNKSKGPDSSSAHDLYNREGLVRYILCCAQDQSKKGGMRDKPSKSPDAYHTCYVLSGLSSAQHVTRLLTSDGEGMMTHSEYDVSPHIGNPQIYEEEDRVNPTDPVYFIPEGKRREVMSYFLSKPGF
ncbi:terpenoid cyclases/Protein prenyltransferase [Durotheca rogersii]|uniref:terpenoid cyclases/Protein prenyltransferase n=1 Tax=Durotheca rogersii TaxID=419775 RepID=UPI00221EABD4|nr:terpenoid cyclases/Protein prenyltransferase [Durotheca rogersii]KAI5866219.1 terpenoid cyclases/Protein prenyltransferase [Durotheca rogersii]